MVSRAWPARRGRPRRGAAARTGPLPGRCGRSGGRARGGSGTRLPAPAGGGAPPAAGRRCACVDRRLAVATMAARSACSTTRRNRPAPSSMPARGARWWARIARARTSTMRRSPLTAAAAGGSTFDTATSGPRVGRRRQHDPVLAERRHDVLDVAQERRRRPDEEDRAGQAGPLGVQQVRGPVERHRRLAGARRPLDDRHAGAGATDHDVLLRLDRGHHVLHAAGPRRVERGQQRTLADEGQPGLARGADVEHLVLEPDQLAVRANGSGVAARRPWGRAATPGRTARRRAPASRRRADRRPRPRRRGDPRRGSCRRRGRGGRRAAGPSRCRARPAGGRRGRWRCRARTAPARAWSR